ncbi:serine hydrolase [Actinoplanes subtropicus]|uniref:serine hydrolase n=1 Tax=Actinoplanes subtropicus TaxID=543632 RepID=UPI0007C57289|nr:serine hydrolase [Actinoplanes subtropicus]
MAEPMSRRTLLRTAAGSVIAAGLPVAGKTAGKTAVPLLRQLDEKIRDGMARYGIPGVALGLWWRGAEYVRGFGVTDVDHPAPVDGDTVFRVASTTKTFTGTAIMRLVERGRLDLGRTVRSYLPDFRTADAAASGRVTLRQVLNHSAGWLGDDFVDTGSDDGALARYVAAMSGLPQLTPPGRVFAYNNAALALAGRLIEVATGRTYEHAARALVLDPLRLAHSGFSLAEIPGATYAVPHDISTGKPVPAPQFWALPRSITPAGGLISSAHDQLRWARFHLGDGRGLLTPRSMRLMQSHPGPGGTLFVELDGVGVTWLLRPTAEGPTVVQHGGDWAGQHSGFLMVPERDFALTVLTNSEGGPGLLAELFSDDWALSRFAGVHNLPATPRALPPAALAGYAGTYRSQEVYFDGSLLTSSLDLVADQGGLSVRLSGTEALRLAFYRRDYVLALAPDGTDTHSRANFVRDPDGTVGWLRFGGRLWRRGTVAGLRAGGGRALLPGTLPHPAPL